MVLSTRGRRNDDAHCLTARTIILLIFEKTQKIKI